MCHLGGFAGQNEIPRVAGQHYDYIVKQLKDFKARQAHQRRRQHGQCRQTLSDEDIENLAPLPRRAVLIRAMRAFIVGTIRVTDPAAWQKYVERVGATFAPHGGHVLLRGAKVRGLAGESHGERVVVAEFADLDALQRWHDSPDYQSLIALRDAGAEVVLTAYQT